MDSSGAKTKTILVDAVDTFVIEGQGVFKEMQDLLEKYPQPKIILSNADDQQLKPFGLENLPYELFTLKHDPDKTDPVYFRSLLIHYGLQAEEVVYFEHNLSAVESARSVGIKSYHYDPDKKDLEALKTFLDQSLQL